MSGHFNYESIREVIIALVLLPISTGLMIFWFLSVLYTDLRWAIIGPFLPRRVRRHMEQWLDQIHPNWREEGTEPIESGGDMWEYQNGKWKFHKVSPSYRPNNEG